jgi:transmembrane sensor
MNDKNIRAAELANKLFNKTITPEEEQELNSWYNQHLDDQVEIPHTFVSSEEEHRVRILEAINVEIGKRRTVKLWPKPAPNWLRGVAVAAAAVAIIVSGLWFYSSKYQDTSIKTERIASVNDIAPGKNGATITLANGKVIQLSDAKTGVMIGDDKLAYNDGSSVGRHPEFISGSRNSKGGGPDLRQDDVMQMTASTARGQTYQFTLPDGTKVWLNADSKLEFPSNFVNSKTRNVKLSGEGYFEVEKDKSHPFIVVTDKQEVTVLGTHFNISSYSDESSVRTTLLEGSVKVASLREGDPSLRSGQAAQSHDEVAASRRAHRNEVVGGNVILQPNQQASLDEKFQIQVQQVVDAERAIAWRNINGKSGQFYFQNEDLESLMRKVERWYDVEVVYRFKYKRTDMNFTGAVSRDATLSQMIRLLQHTGSFTFKIEGRRLIIMD